MPRAAVTDLERGSNEPVGGRGLVRASSRVHVCASRGDLSLRAIENRSRRGVIVDGYSTGSKLPPLLQGYELECIHVQSTDPPLPFFARSFRKHDFIECHVHTGDVSALAAKLAARSPEFVIPGCESGVRLADALAAALGLPGNDCASTPARTDKLAMQSALERRGLAHIPSFAASSADEALAWMGARAPGPCVVKPLDSGGSDGVVFCYSERDVRVAFARFLGAVNALGAVNRRLLVQPKLEGTQYIVNTVSMDGRHHVSDVWRDNRTEIANACYVGNFEELLAEDEPAFGPLRVYAFAALDAVGVSHGPCHLEIMAGAKGEDPTLIELGARMQGAICDDVVRGALGHSQVTLTAMRYADPAEFDRATRGGRAQPRQSVLAAMLIAPRDAVVASDAPAKRIRALETYARDLGLPGKGDRVRRTVDMTTCPGIVYLAHVSASRVREDLQRLRAIEASMYG